MVHERVKRLLAERVTSYEQIQILLLLRREPEERWTSERVSETLAMPVSVTRDALDALVAAKLVRRLSTTPALFGYSPGEPSLARDVDHLAAAHDDQLLELMQLIASAAVGRIRSATAAMFLDGLAKRRADGG